MKFAFIRVFGILLAMASVLLPSAHFFTFLIFTPLAFSHYLIGYIYSRGNLKKSFQSKKRKWVFLGFSLISLTVCFFKIPAAGLIFGFHFALTDAFLFRLYGQNYGSALVTSLRFFLNLLVYMRLFDSAVTPADQGLGFLVNTQFLDPVIFLLIGAMFFFLLREKGNFSRKVFLDIWAFEALTVSFFIFSFFTGEVFSLRELLAYHFFQWCILPSFVGEKSFKEASRPFFESFAALILFSSLIYLLSDHTEGVWDDESLLNHYIKVSVLYIGYFHIILTPFMSRLNPEWINRWTGLSLDKNS